MSSKKSSRMLGVLTVSVLVCVAAAVWLRQHYAVSPVVTIQQILADPQSSNGKHVAVKGVLVKNVGAYLGSAYSLYVPGVEMTRDTPHIELSVASVSEDLIGFTYDGSTFQRRDGCPQVTVEGIFRDRGLVADAARYFIEAFDRKTG